jgi:N-glycosylase/DNA lyase
LITSFALSESLEYAVQKTVNKIEKTVYGGSWETYHENEVFREIISNILGSQVHFETANYYTQQLHEKGLINIDWINNDPDDFEDKLYNALLSPPYNRSNLRKRIFRYRYPRLRANHIRRTAESVYGKRDTFKGILSQCCDARVARKKVMERTVGIGPKQASLFLRNIGFSDDLAILDTHVLRYMFILKLTPQRIRSVPRINDYEMVERKLMHYAFQMNHKLSNLDMAIWIVMRVYTTEFARWE